MGFSKVTGTVLLFGIGMIATGMLMNIFKGTLVNRIIGMFWIEDTPFLDLMNVQYNVMALIIMLMGIICVFISASEARSQRGFSQ